MSEDEQPPASNVIPLPTQRPDETLPDEVRALSDHELALGFTAENDTRLKYVGKWNRWLVWNGIKWEFDDTLFAYDRVRKYVTNISKRVRGAIYDRMLGEISPALPKAIKAIHRIKAKKESSTGARSLESSHTINAVASLSRSDRRIASRVDDWDSDPWLLNTPDGTIDLRTGAMLKHSPLNYITRSTAASPSAASPPTLWLAFLRRIMREDEAMITYLQKVFGYCLVGETKEHQMYFGYGTGANGKGVAINTIRGLLGDYGVEASIETFIITSSDRHPTELADLRGARLVTCGETDEGQRWAEARIKMLTGGDPVKARFMRQDFFQYQPQFKLFLAGNHKPRLSNVDEAIERRFRLIPFTFTVPKPERDPDLGTKLRAEWPAILHWAVEGCLAWQREGLEPPSAVSAATKSYLSQEDAITSWFNECLTYDQKGFVYLQDLFHSWENWCRRGGENIGTKRMLSQKLEEREHALRIRKGDRSKGTGFYNIELLASPTGAASE